MVSYLVVSKELGKEADTSWLLMLWSLFYAFSEVVLNGEQIASSLLSGRVLAGNNR